MKYIFMFIGGLSIFFFGSCNFLDPRVEQNIPVQKEFPLDVYKALANGMYSKMTAANYYGRNYIVLGEVRSEYGFSGGNTGRFPMESDFTKSPTSGESVSCYLTIYSVIQQANLVLESVVLKEERITAGNTAAHLKGQAYAVRALGHFDLLKLYGQHYLSDDPLAQLGIVKEETNKISKSENYFPKRATVQEIKTFIENDLDSAILYMSKDTTNYGNRRDGMTTYAVYALKSRVALYFGDYDKVITNTEIIVASKKYKYKVLPSADYLASFSQASTSLSPNWIMGLVQNEKNNLSANSLSNIYNKSYTDARPSKKLKDLLNKDAKDIRKKIIGKLSGKEGDWGDGIGNVGKFKTDVSNIPLIRYEEVLLNYAEALFRKNRDITNALKQINAIRVERGLEALTTLTETDILEERAKELCFEGFSFDDMMRLKKSLNRPAQSGGIPALNIAFPDTRFSSPIPLTEINVNKNMRQNQGY